MSRRPKPLFLARESYRIRRAHDAGRLLPILGAALFLLPVFWTVPEPGALGTAGAYVYLFVCWAGLIVIAAVLSRKLRDGEGEDLPPAEPPAELPLVIRPQDSAAPGEERG